MNKTDQTIKKSEIYKKYHIPGCHNYMKRPKNAVFISPGNSLEHEQLKLKTCYELRKEGIDFITEACRNNKDDNGKIRRVDIVNLNTGDEIEIETTKKRAKRFEGEPGVIVIKGWLND